MLEDDQIIDTADKWQAQARAESKRRFDVLTGIGSVVLALLAVGGGVGFIYVQCSASNAEDQAAGIRRTLVYEACLEQGLGTVCTCLIDKGVCQEDAESACRGSLSEQECRCLLDARTCARMHYEECLLTMSAEDCRCLNDVDSCVE